MTTIQKTTVPVPAHLHPELAAFAIHGNTWAVQSEKNAGKGFDVTASASGETTGCACGEQREKCWHRRRVEWELLDGRAAREEMAAQALRKQSQAEQAARLRAPLNPNTGFSLLR